MTQENPFLIQPSVKDHALPFDKIKTEHFLPALKKAIDSARFDIDKIKSDQSTPQFSNVIEALEFAEESIGIVLSAFSSLESAHGTEDLRELAKEIYPLATSIGSDILLDSVLFNKVKFVYDTMNTENLSPEQIQLTKKTYINFVRNGALLPPDAKEKLRAIDQEMSLLSPQFSENVLKATNEFELWISEEKDLEGLPESAIESAKSAASSKGHPSKWLFTLHAPSYIPFLTYSAIRSLREKIWRGFNTRAYKGPWDNQENIKKIIKLREERAHLLGFKNHAAFVLEERMAKDSETVQTFLQDLLKPAKDAAQKEVDEIKKFAWEIDKIDNIMPWDWPYYSEKLKEKKYSFSEEELRPYFKIENVVEGVFEHARRLYDLKFLESKEIPVYHEDVRVYEVFEESTNKYIGLLYTDFFPRETKRNGAWMTSFKEQGLLQGKVHRPHISIVCNFTEPTPTKPSLLTFEEVLTLFHEFGHALHGLLSNCQYRSLGGTNVYWDFVELPSQIMENWVKQKESLDIFAQHYETKEPIPNELFEKIKKAEKYQAGYFALRQIQFGVLDLAWHTVDSRQINAVDEFEKQVTSEYRLIPFIEGTNSSCSFSHIFAGGYSAGYYSYKWAEVLDADAFEYFLEQGLFNKKVAQKFKENILSRGGTEHPMDLYVKFRGRKPDTQALLRRDGLK